jgi:predicted PurR-regulated permease PerM
MPLPSPTEKQARTIWAGLTALAVGVLLTILAGLIWGLGWLLHLLSPVLWPLAIGGILAYLLDPVVDYFERKKIPRGRAIILVFILCALALTAFFASIIPRVVRESGRLISDLPEYSRKLQGDLNQWMSSRPILDKWRGKLFPSSRTNYVTISTNGTNITLAISPDGQTNIVTSPPPKVAEHAWTEQVSQRVLEWLGDTLPKMGSWLGAQLSRVASWAGMIIGLALVPVFTYYFLQEKTGIQKGWTNYLPVMESRFKDELVFCLNAINDYLIVFFRGQVVVAFCIGVLLTIGFLAIGLNYAVILGILAGVLSIVPYLGAILTIIPAMILAAVQFKDWLHPLLVLAIFALVQTLEGFVISPKIMGDRVGLHPLTIIIAVMVGTTLLGGILGGILAIPLTAALRVLMFRYIWKRRQGVATVA